MSFKTIAEVRAANKAAGHHFFERSTMRFFDSAVESALYGGRFFVTSEKGPVAESVRRYTVREVSQDGKVSTRGEFQAYRTIEDAREAARELAAATRVRSTRADDEAAHFRCEG